MSKKMMTKADRIVIQSVTMKGKNYLVKWLPHALHKNLIICAKSSFLSYDMFCKCMEEHYMDDSYESETLYFVKASKGSSTELQADKVSRPLDIMILPVKDNSIYLPQNEEELQQIAHVCKGIINLRRSVVRDGFFSSTNTLSLVFSGTNVDLGSKEIIAKYVINQKSYPVTVNMLDRLLEIQVKRDSDFSATIVDAYKDKYKIREDEM